MTRGADGVVRGAAAGVADDVGVSFCETSVFGGVKAGVHTGEDGEAAGRWERDWLCRRR